MAGDGRPRRGLSRLPDAPRLEPGPGLRPRATAWPRGRATSGGRRPGSRSRRAGPSWACTTTAGTRRSSSGSRRPTGPTGSTAARAAGPRRRPPGRGGAGDADLAGVQGVRAARRPDRPDRRWPGSPWSRPAAWLAAWRWGVRGMAVLAPSLAVARAARAVATGAVEAEFARWFRPDGVRVRPLPRTRPARAWRRAGGRSETARGPSRATWVRPSSTPMSRSQPQPSSIRGSRYPASEAEHARREAGEDHPDADQPLSDHRGFSRWVPRSRTTVPDLTGPARELTGPPARGQSRDRRPISDPLDGPPMDAPDARPTPDHLARCPGGSTAGSASSARGSSSATATWSPTPTPASTSSA